MSNAADVGTNISYSPPDADIHDVGLSLNAPGVENVRVYKWVGVIGDEFNLAHHLYHPPDERDAVDSVMSDESDDGGSQTPVAETQHVHHQQWNDDQTTVVGDHETAISDQDTVSGNQEIHHAPPGVAQSTIQFGRPIWPENLPNLQSLGEFDQEFPEDITFPRLGSVPPDPNDPLWRATFETHGHISAPQRKGLSLDVTRPVHDPERLNGIALPDGFLIWPTRVNCALTLSDLPPSQEGSNRQAQYTFTTLEFFSPLLVDHRNSSVISNQAVTKVKALISDAEYGSDTLRFQCLPWTYSNIEDGTKTSSHFPELNFQTLNGKTVCDTVLYDPQSGLLGISILDMIGYPFGNNPTLGRIEYWVKDDRSAETIRESVHARLQAASDGSGMEGIMWCEPGQDQRSPYVRIVHGPARSEGTTEVQGAQGQVTQTEQTQLTPFHSW